MKIKADRYYKYCVNCHRYSYGKPFCKYCYERYYNISDKYKNDLKRNDPFIDKLISKKDNEIQIQKTCAYCNNESGNNEFCTDCYNKYFNYKPIQKNIENKYKEYKLKNGIFVKSKSELLIGNFLLNHHIKFEYEKPFQYLSYKKPLKPDFYIKGPRYFKGRWLKDIYIEHLGGAKSNDPKEQEKYKEIINYKIPIYKTAGITLVCTYEEDMSDLETILTEKLKYCSIGMINYLKES